MSVDKFFCVALLLVLFNGCSKNPVSEAEISLEIDGSTIIKEKRNYVDSKGSNIEEKIYKTIDVITRACDLAMYLRSYSETRELDSTHRGGKNINIETSAKLSFNSPINNNGSRIVCDSGRDKASPIAGCHFSSTGTDQQQYHLDLLEMMRNQYGMRHSAKWLYRNKTESKGITATLVESMSMDMFSYECSDDLVEKIKLSK